MTIENALSALGLLGIGGAMGTYLRILWERRNAALLHKQEFKEARFKCIIILMYSIIDFDKHRSALEQHRPNLRSCDDVIEELKAEWHNAIFLPRMRFWRRPTLSFTSHQPPISSALRLLCVAIFGAGGHRTHCKGLNFEWRD